MCLPDSLGSFEIVTDVFLFSPFLILIYVNIVPHFAQFSYVLVTCFNNYEKNMIKKQCFYNIKPLEKGQKVKNYINCICAYYKIKAILSLLGRSGYTGDNIAYISI